MFTNYRENTYKTTNKASATGIIGLVLVSDINYALHITFLCKFKTASQFGELNSCLSLQISLASCASFLDLLSIHVLVHECKCTNSNYNEYESG